MQSLKEYIPIVLIKDQISKREFNLQGIEEKIPLNEYENKSPKISFHINSSRSNSIQKTIPSIIKTTVFPNILQQTKLAIIRYRQSQQLYLDPDSLPIQKESNGKIEKKIRNLKQNKSSSKIHAQSTKHSTQKPIITQITTLIKDNISIQRKNSIKLRSHSPEIELQVWQMNSKLRKINKANETQKEIHYFDRSKICWKTDEIQQILQQKYLQTYNNIIKGLNKIFILIYLPNQDLYMKNSQIQTKLIINNLELNVFPFFIPIYEKIINDKELNDNFREWVSYFLNILHLQNHMNYVKAFTLDGVEINQLNQISIYDRLLYIQLQGQFDIWNILRQQLNLQGQFQLNKYPKLAIKLLDLKQKDEILKFFKKRENLVPFYFQQQQQQQSSTSFKSQYLIELENDLRLPDEDMFEQSIIQMNEQEQDTYLKLLQHYIKSNKTKYSSKLKSLEEMMRSRLEKIKAMKRYSIQVKLQSKKQLEYQEKVNFERKLIQENEKSIQEIQEEVFDEIMPQNTHIFKKKQKQIQSIEDPFQSFSNKDNKKFKEITQLINIEKIVLEKNLSRQDIYYYLSLFKALMDSDSTRRIKDINYPTLFISVEQLKRGIAFIALYKNIVNTKKLAEVYNREYQYCEFMEFLDIFTIQDKIKEEELKNIEMNADDSQEKEMEQCE
ncbi:unnamed protein product [Paramecium sonneborni]|uniref:Uncharacterized protein n=1 Tax=Paramecium sonneborni TaxID=65129 RepID=A0A8S1LIN8_9CILI|nr:unnamed protein product [Paramecium sonneborni]